MRVFFREEDTLILKEATSVSVSRGRVIIESDAGDQRVHVTPHSSWTNDDLEQFLRQQLAQDVINLEPVVVAR